MGRILTVREFGMDRYTLLYLKWITNKDGFSSGSVIKNLPARQEMQETQVQSLGWEESLEEGTATHSSIPAWRIPWTEGAWQATVHRVTQSWTQLKRLGTHIINKDLLCSSGMLNVMRQPGWEGSWGRMDTCMCMTESLRCSPETTTILFINRLYPNTNEKV